MELLEYEERHLKQLREYIGECTVLLKKDGSFPLEKPCEIALFGSGARRTIKGGTGSGEVNSRFFITVEEGLKERGFTVTTGKWLDEYDEVYRNARRSFIKDVRANARKNKENAVVASMGTVMPEPEFQLPLEGKGEAAVYVLSRISGEGSDRKFVKGDFLLTDSEVRDIMELNKKHERFMG